MGSRTYFVRFSTRLLFICASFGRAQLFME
jgi:hypothetical protein